MASELARRLAFTLGALLIYRLGSNIPLPGINPKMFAGVNGATEIRALAIFSLGILPYISAAVFLQVAGIVSRRLRALQIEGDRGRQVTRRITLALTIGLSAFQAYGIAAALEGMGTRVVENPGLSFLILTTLTLTGGTIFLAWLSEQITAFGIGNGIALMLLATSVATIRDPIDEIIYFYESQRGLPSSNSILGPLGAILIITVLVVFIERARRCFRIDYPKRPIGDRMFDSQSSVLPVKLNPAGIIPALLAPWLLSILIIFVGLVANLDPRWSDLVATQLMPGAPAYLVLYAALIFLCTFFYAAYVFSPLEIAERLQRGGAAIRSVAPGATVAHLDFALSRTVFIGAIYFTAICIMPRILAHYMPVPFYFNGLWLLILVCTVVDLEDQIKGYVAISRRTRPDTTAPQIADVRDS